MTERAYKFTRPGARSPFTGFEWPFGEWVEAHGEVGLCSNGIHACRVEALPRWIDDELWLVQLDGVVDEVDGVVVAKRAKLLERIDDWNRETSLALALSCADSARKLADEHRDHPLLEKMAADIATFAVGPDPSATALCMYTTAHAYDVAFPPEGYYAERKRQAEWIRDRLGLVTA